MSIVPFFIESAISVERSDPTRKVSISSFCLIASNVWAIVSSLKVRSKNPIFSLFLQGIRYIGPVKATLIGCLEPATATVLSAVFLGTRFGVMEMIGFGAILGTVFLSMDRPETGKEEKKQGNGRENLYRY